MTASALIECAPMTAGTRDAAFALISDFLVADSHYRASSAVYGDGGRDALARALELFLARPELGFVWLAFADVAAAPNEPRVPVGACVVCFAISTSRGALVAKLDDVTIDRAWHGRGVGTAMLTALCEHLCALGVTRIDTACHRDNGGAWRFYERLGFRSLDETRMARLIDARDGAPPRA